MAVARCLTMICSLSHVPCVGLMDLSARSGTSIGFGSAFVREQAVNTVGTRVRKEINIRLKSERATSQRQHEIHALSSR